jgi:uncharacterized protein
MRSPFRKLLFSCLLFVCSFAVLAQVPSRPSPARLVNNLSTAFPDFLSASEERQLEDTLEAFSRATSNQICIVIVDDLNGMEAIQYATAILKDWGVGQKDKNNGVVVLVKPTGGESGRDLCITTGYGLEGAITDIETQRIQQNEIIPNFREGKNYEGLYQGCKALMIAAKGEYNVAAKGKSSRIPNYAWVIIVIVIIVLAFRRRGGGGGGFYRGGSYYGGGFGGGSSWGGGGSSGGFGGFGGGSGGGGGSSSKW